MTRSQIREQVRGWCEIFDVERPVRIHFSRKGLGERELADCRLTKSKKPSFVITFDPEMVGHPMTILLLAHEFAHVLAWETCGRHDHSPEWGVSLARIWAFDTETEIHRPF